MLPASRPRLLATLAVALAVASSMAFAAKPTRIVMIAGASEDSPVNGTSATVFRLTARP